MENEKGNSDSKKDLWTIEELEAASGLTKRTIKYYVQLRLISPAIGETRGARYSAAHLQEIQFIKNLQGKGYSLKKIQEMKPRADDVIPKKRQIAAPHLFLEFYLGQGVYLKFDSSENKFEEKRMKELAVKISELIHDKKSEKS